MDIGERIYKYVNREVLTNNYNMNEYQKLMETTWQ